ncbi:MAG TPA: cytosine permease [Verrucomicrobiae bacterium]|jgi:NCS1 family nucleobase:cation symporter-1|nr:cytosine permease [Verrucomicrobiae bacterium]
MREPVYRDQILEIEPTGIETVTAAQRHGHPRDLFGVWFSANAEIATWMVGVFVVGLYGTDMRSAVLGIVIGNVVGFALLGVLALFGPRYGVPQMVAARLAFGRYGNLAPATLSFLAGVGWFAINTIFGSYALQTITGLPYFACLLIMLVLQVALAVYGYNMIAAFEKTCVVLLAAGFILLSYDTFKHLNWAAPFNPHAPIAAGGALAGFIFATALAFSYATGWVPAACDYSRYLPEKSDARKVFLYSFVGCAFPCIALEILGAATVVAVPTVGASSIPTDAIATLLGSGIVAKLVLLTVVLGTLTANCMNLYSGALAALVAFSVRVPRWIVAAVVGVLGALIASAGGHPKDTAAAYTNFLLLLSYWASPWAAVVLVDWLRRGGAAADPQNVPLWRNGTMAWLVGLAASGPFWNQAIYTGPFAKAFPQLGDLSYYVGFIVAALVMWALPRASRAVVLAKE